MAQALAASTANSVGQIAQDVTPYVTALTDFNYKFSKISWPTAVELQSEELTIQVRSFITFLSTISSTSSATLSSWLTELRAHATTTQSADNAVRSKIDLSPISDFP
jgi:hypothetical protein